eukprot:CAMPEP_0173068660 /NCGR_PEP_ID=MMETSP1102-20130122/7549_1 /TAXON_ID=49646 /ORGANISM="Geminigera sp., Strain Caron Lab Isolate" /LENGTH=313 /DNA_ID=CAMNT_0013936571 /DNA_START=72 /DNA_END=1013 /DNA_ORIENTATION=-
MSPAAESGLRLLFLWLIVFPSVCCLFSALFAGPIAVAEKISYEDAFVFCMQALTLCDAVPLTTFTPAGTAGQILTLFIGIILQMILVVHIGISAGPCMDPFLTEVKNDSNYFVSRTVGSLVKKMLMYFFLLYPSVCLIFAGIAGGILAAAEGWPWADGFVMVLGEATLTGITNPGTPPPQGAGGKIIAVFIAVIAQGIMGITIALGSVPLLGFDLSFDNSPLKHVALWVFNSEQKKDLMTPEKPDQEKPSDDGITSPSDHAITNPAPNASQAPMLANTPLQYYAGGPGGLVYSASPMQNYAGTSQLQFSHGLA